MYTVIYSLYTTCFGFFETGVSDFQPVCVYAFLSCISAFSLVYHCILNVYMPHIRLFFSFFETIFQLLKFYHDDNRLDKRRRLVTIQLKMQGGRKKSPKWTHHEFTCNKNKQLIISNNSYYVM